MIARLSPMRHSFLLHVEFGRDLRGQTVSTQAVAIQTVAIQNRKFVTKQLKEIASQQDMHAFSYEEDSSGQYAFFARPDLVDERTDLYEVGALREVLRVWLENHPDIVRFELGAVTDLDMITPKVGDTTAAQQDSQDSTVPKYDGVILIGKDFR